MAEGIIFKTQAEVLEKLKEFGLPTQRYWWLCKEIGEVAGHAQELQKLRARLPYEIDGAVIKINNLEQWKRLGTTAKAPRYAIAYKYAREQATTSSRIRRRGSQWGWQIGSRNPRPPDPLAFCLRYSA
jgi:NAD-dependent DNA ligase